MNALVPVLYLFALISGLILCSLVALWLVPVRFVVWFISGDGLMELTTAVCWGPVRFRRMMRDGLSVTEVLVFNHVVSASAEEPGTGLPETAGKKAKGGIRTAPDLIPVITILAAPASRILRVLYDEGRFERCDGRVRVGLGDPASTGMLYGSYWATRFLFTASRIFIRVEPVFDRKVLELDLAVRYGISHPLRILVQAVSEYLRPDTRSAIAALNREAKEPS